MRLRHLINTATIGLAVLTLGLIAVKYVCGYADVPTQALVPFLIAGTAYSAYLRQRGR